MVPGDVDELHAPGRRGFQRGGVAADQSGVLDGEQGRRLASFGGPEHTVPAGAVDGEVGAALQLPEVAVVVPGGLRRALLRRHEIRVVEQGENLGKGRKRPGPVQGHGGGAAPQAAAPDTAEQGVAVGIKIGDPFHIRAFFPVFCPV